MKYKGRYFIGDMSKICNISKKALRYYDEINLIPSHRHDYNQYRYYTYESLLAVPVIKYYKQMGFTLDEMRKFIEGNTANIYKTIQHSFLKKIEELEQEQEKIRRKHHSVKDWYELVVEAEMVMENNIQEVSIKYVQPSKYLFQNQTFESDLMAAIINIDFTKHVEDLDNEITGPVILNFSSYKKRLEKSEQPIRILQKTLRPLALENQASLGGHMMATCYHIGSHDDIEKTYKKIIHWAQENNYILHDSSYERYVTDYWTTRNTSQFVTEVMMRVSREKASARN